MSARYRFVWNMLPHLAKFGYKPTVNVPKVHRKFPAPYMLGFSLFTWLGFQKKLSAEDELILTIKHCVLFIQRTEYVKAEQLLHIALRQAQQMHNQLGITYIHDLMANLALQREQYDKAKDLFISVTQRIMADGAKEDDLRVIHLSTKLARISHLKKDYTTAQLGYDWCLEKIHKKMATDTSEETKKLLAMTEDWYGRLFLDCNNHEQGVKLMVSSLNRMKEVSDVEQQHIVLQLNDIGTVYHNLGQIDESINYFNQAIEIGTALEMEDLGVFYVNLGRAYIKKNLLSEARKKCGHGWKLAVLNKSSEIKNEAELCFKQINNMI